MEFADITERYYSRWLGSEENLFRSGCSANFIFSAERDRVQTGYGDRFDLYVLATESALFVSYGGAALGGKGALKAAAAARRSADDFAEKIAEIYGVRPSHGIKFVFSGKAPAPGGARALRADDYASYEAFFRRANPDCADVSWLREYFDRLAAERLCCGVFADGALVSCTDSPSVPYMEDFVREVGIETLPEHRRQGYARAACALCVEEIVKGGKCPIWSADASNAASLRLAESAGFAKFADCYTLTL